MTSTVRRFLFEGLDIRGAIVHLGDAWQQMQAGRDYQPGHYLELPDGKAQWLVSTGAARTAPAATPGPAAKKE